MATGVMKQPDAQRRYGVRVGLVSGLFSIGQVLLSVSAAHGSEAAVRSMQQAVNTLTSGGIADPTLLIGPLVPMLLTTYLSMLGVGLLCVWFSGQAGRMAATAQGQRAGGAKTGVWVWLVSSIIWIAASIIATVITGSDGTLSGVFTGTYSHALLVQELALLVVQEVIAASVCLGFCVLAAAQGARNAELVAPDPFPVAVPAFAGYPPAGWRPYAPYPTPGYPYPHPQQPGAGYPAYPAYPGYPGYPAGWPPPPPPAQQGMAQPYPAPVYPPPPSFYMPQPAEAPTSEATPTTPPPPAD